MANEYSVRLNAEQLAIAEQLAGCDDFPDVRIARSNDGTFAIGRNKEQVARFRSALSGGVSNSLG